VRLGAVWEARNDVAKIKIHHICRDEALPHLTCNNLDEAVPHLRYNITKILDEAVAHLYIYQKSK
jgi:hypothetical protein